MITLDFIKKTVEGFSNIKDISIKSREIPMPDIRYVYMALCRYLRNHIKNYSLKNVGKCINRDHASVLHGLKQFDNLYGNKSFKGNEVYQKSLAFLLEYIDGSEVPEDIQKENIINHYRVRQIMLTDKYRQIINKQQRKIDYLSKNDLLIKVSELEDTKLEELAVKLDAFFKVNL